MTLFHRSAPTAPEATHFLKRGLRLIVATAIVVAGAGGALYEVFDPGSAITRWISLGVFFGIVACARLLETRYRFHRQVEKRLNGLHRASQILSAQGESDEVIATFLSEVRESFQADVAELVVERSEGMVISRVFDTGKDSYVRALDTAGSDGLRAYLMRIEGTRRVSRRSDGVVAERLKGDGYRNCLVTALPSRDLNPGFLVVYNHARIDDFDGGEVAVIEALAREVAGSFEKGKLFAAIVEERYKLSRIVDSTFDGVMTLSADGVVRSWNPGWEQITGISARDVLGHEVDRVMELTYLNGETLLLSQWITSLEPLPEELQVLDSNGRRHWLQCSYRAEVDEAGSDGLLIVVAHDKTGEREIEQLREEVDALAELEALQRARVLQVQDSLKPEIPAVPEAEFGVFYQPSDTTAPTGGDFYDWQMLPGGHIHVAVVDVLGSGIEATNDAFAVIHTLRTLAFQGIPVDQLIVEADNLLAALDSELVATVICARYDPTTGRARLAGGGHPPALVVRTDGSVEEIAAPGGPVGWPGAGSDHPIDVVLEPGDALLLYTDGLIEAHRDILKGLSTLAENAAETRNYPVDELARVLVERSLEGAAQRDDSLALVLRHRVIGPVVTKRTFQYRAHPQPQEVGRVRHAFNDWLELQTGIESLTDDLAVVMSELATNSARLGNTFFEVRASCIEAGVLLEVEDDGDGFDYQDIDIIPGMESEHGRGLLIVRTMVDDLIVLRTARGCVVRAITKVRAHGDLAWEEPHTTDA